MNLEMLTAFFGWMALINIAFLTISSVMLMMMKDWVAGLHGRLFGVDATKVKHTIYGWLGAYKILLLIFSLVPYIALRIIG